MSRQDQPDRLIELKQEFTKAYVAYQVAFYVGSFEAINHPDRLASHYKAGTEEYYIDPITHRRKILLIHPPTESQIESMYRQYEKDKQREEQETYKRERPIAPKLFDDLVAELAFIVPYLEDLCEGLAEEPIKVPTGQKRMVKRIQPHITYLTHESERLTIPRKTIMHPQRTYADVLNEVASQLTNLPVFTAQVKITTDNGIEEHTIKTLDPKQDRDRPLIGQDLQDRIASIKTQNIQNGYLRKRAEVEAEIRQRQEQCSQPPQDEPPISRRPQR